MTPQEAEKHIVYAMIVAGKSAVFTNRVMEAFLAKQPQHMTSFEKIRFWHAHNALENKLHELRTGNYTKLTKGFIQLANSDIDLLTCQPSDLEVIHGIGPKTSRFFIMWIRPEEHWAALDVHVLRWLRTIGYEAAPLATPAPGRAYDYWQEVFLAEARKRNKTPRQLDHEIWSAGTSAKNIIK